MPHLSRRVAAVTACGLLGVVWGVTPSHASSPPIADPNFAAVLTLPASQNGMPTSVVALGDGRTLVAGEFGLTAASGFWVARLLADGQLDTSYGTTGFFEILSPPAGPSARVSGTPTMVAIDGRAIILADDGSGTEIVYGLTSAGSLDSSFGDPLTPGTVEVPGAPSDGTIGPRLAVDSSHRIYALGGGSRVVRLSGSGVIDLAYVSPALVASTQPLPHGAALAVDGAGHAIVLLQSQVQGVDRTLVMRLGVDGSIDPTFAPQDGGIVPLLGPDDRAVDVAVGIDGSIVTLLRRTDVSSIVKLGPDGHDATGWDRATPLHPNDNVVRIAVDPDNAVLTFGLGQVMPAVSTGLVVRRYLASGEVDAAFNQLDTPGAAYFGFGKRPIYAGAMSLDALGRVVIGGAVSSSAPPIPWLARLLPDRPASAMPYFPLVPKRLLETRSGYSTSDGLYNGIGMLSAGSVTTLQVTGRAGVPMNSAAASLNVAVTEPVASGFVTVYPCDATRPTASNGNYAAGTTASNMVIAKLSSAGTACIFTSQSTHLLVDIYGTYPSTLAYAPVQPARLMDTRADVTPTMATIDGRFAGIGIRPAGSTTVLDVAGRGGVVPGSAAVALNVAVVAPRRAGFVTVYPCDAALPIAANVNFVAGQTVSNASVVSISPEGTVCLYTSQTTHLVVDVNGAYRTGQTFNGLVPRRLMDTRPSGSTTDGRFQGTGLVAEQSVTELQVTGRGGVPQNATAVILNVAITEPTAAGFVTVFACGADVPNAATVNFEVGQTISNAVTTRTSASGTVCLFVWEPTHIVVDVTGAFDAQVRG